MIYLLLIHKSIIQGGILNITTTLNTSDDAVHSNNIVYIDGGSTTIASGDDGLHGDSYVVCDSGSIKMTASYEGVEASNITINGGKLIYTGTTNVSEMRP